MLNLLKENTKAIQEGLAKRAAQGKQQIGLALMVTFNFFDCP
jgi:hypothetical protein